MALGIIVGIILAVFTIIFLLAFLLIKDKKEAFGFDRNMKDSELVRRLLKYAKPHALSFLFVLFLMIFSIWSTVLFLPSNLRHCFP